LARTFQTIAKSGLILAGGAFVIRSLRFLESLAQNTRGVAESAEIIESLQARVDAIHLVVARLGRQGDQLQVQLDQMATTMVPKAEVGTLDRGVEERFERQGRSVEALRVMVGQTDELLQRVLDGLEGMALNDEQETDARFDFTHARG
jgi:hypothetical protein